MTEISQALPSQQCPSRSTARVVVAWLEIWLQVPSKMVWCVVVGTYAEGCLLPIAMLSFKQSVKSGFTQIICLGFDAIKELSPEPLPCNTVLHLSGLSRFLRSLSQTYFAVKFGGKSQWSPEVFVLFCFNQQLNMIILRS